MKKWYTSKTLWVAFLIFGGSLLKATGVIDVPLEENAVWIGMAIGVVQFILRLVTKSEVVIE
jgi:hypothetical protein